MFTPMGRVLSNEQEPPPNLGTEYRECFLSPRREDYGPRAVLPKVPVKRSLSNRSVLSCDLDKNPLSDSSEYRLCYENYRPRRPYIFHEQRSQVFDYVPKPLNPKPTAKAPPKNTNSLSDTEYHERFPNYRSFIPTRELLPAHISANSDVQSHTQRKREEMRRSQYFQQLIADNERLSGGRDIGTSEQRTAFQWPLHLSETQRTPRQSETPTFIPKPYFTPRNIYEPLPPIQRASVDTTN
ncbi:unnamed protein product [Adineta ricciae]|uniref:Uncharacterized protein n=1 Tax=Adineta ricciae TaxID=249248 RepID=A0A813UAM6_ADIRI|nr:unnamed protein product [Adineta ricciae]CAF0826225.1 unnamed protein product [Adineta ricciae]